MLFFEDSKSVNMSLPLPDRRQSARYRIRQGLMVINPNILGPVLDLSLHGMSFEYSGESFNNEQITTIGLFATQHRTLITDIHVRTVRDHISDNISCFMPIIRKIRAVEFLSLTMEQKEAIQTILNNTSQF